MSVDIRMTYSNTGLDFSSVLRKVEDRLRGFEKGVLGRDHYSNIGGRQGGVDHLWSVDTSPIDARIIIGRFTSADEALVNQAVEQSRAAFRSWSTTDWRTRSSYARAFAKKMADRKIDLALASLIEVGKSYMEALGEAEEAVDLLNYYADEIEKNEGYVMPLVGDARETRTSVLRPIGPFAVIAPFNFPIALAVNMIAGAIITGNTVVFKPSPGCGVSASMIADAALEAGLPPGVINLLFGGGDVGEILCRHPSVAGVAFTGSHAVGMKIARAGMAGPYAKPVIAEMGGKNPAYVAASANIPLAAEGIARSAFGLQGQKCSACSVVYVVDDVKEELIESLISFTENLKLGDPRDKSVFVGPVFNLAAVSRFEAAVELARDQGKIVAGGDRDQSGALIHGNFVRPTIVELPGRSRLTTDELFLPFVAIRSVASLEAGIAEGNDVNLGLAAGIYSESRRDIDYFLTSAEAGVLYANRASGATTGAWPGLQSFCGWKGSGVTNKGGLGPRYLPQFMREQSHTLAL